ncbi:MAG TPA: hypothetical protein VKP30_16960 [Polyangiaceae bacterium]|nr:hypothetical protein [Polyangiaceae bacterium]
MRRSTLFGAPLAVLTLSLATEATAQDLSKTVLALDLDFAGPLSELGVNGGGGGAVRVGRKLDLVLLSLTPEIGGGYHAFSGANGGEIYQGFLGGRVGIGKVFEPSIFAHIGLGRLSAEVTKRTAATFEAGAAFDFTLLPLIDLGAHASYNVLLPRDNYASFNWYLLGLHVALEF